MADSLFVYWLPSTNVRKDVKYQTIAQLVGSHVSNLPSLSDAIWEPLAQGFTRTTTRYHFKWLQLRLLFLFAEAVKQTQDREVLLRQPREVQKLLDGILETAPRPERAHDFRHAVLHLMFPDDYERIISNRDKRRILERYEPLIVDQLGGDEDTDAGLRLIRGRIQERPEHRDHFDFYDLRKEWRQEQDSDDDQDDNQDESRKDASPRYWVEKTLVENRTDRQTGPHALGRALWSPQRATGGQDFYANMRRVGAGDIIFHVLDEGRLAGISRAAGPAEDSYEGLPFVGLPGTQWAGRPAYRIPLEDFVSLEPPIQRNEYLDAPEHREALLTIRRKSAGTRLLFNRDLDLDQGAYLTTAPPELAALWDGIYQAKTGRRLPHLSDVRVPAPESPSRSWIFQANPSVYDARQAVRQLPEDDWTVTGYRDQIQPGDRVYIWESGPQGGILATARALDLPAIRPLLPASQRFVTRPEKLAGEQWRVRIAIEEPLDPIVTREQVHAHPELSKMLIFRQPQATNFPVTTKEAELLEDLIAARSTQSDLRSPDVLRRLYREFELDRSYDDWQDRLAAFLSEVEQADQERRSTLEFQQRLWDANPVSSLGQGSIDVGQALADQDFRRWIATTSLQQLPKDRGETERALESVYDELVKRLQPSCPRIPRLKIFRVLTALFPRHFTAIADRDRLRVLHGAMFADAERSSVKRHLDVLRRLEDVLGPAPADLPRLVRRIIFPWYLSEKVVAVQPPGLSSQPFQQVLAALKSQGLFFTEEVVSNYLLALQTKRFVILTGISGTGKSQLAMEVAASLSGESRRCVEPVRPDWTDNRGLLGYLNPLTNQYVPTRFLTFLLEARAEEQKAAAEDRDPIPFFMILDEMNLARVEHYFADFLSCLESGEPLMLHHRDTVRTEESSSAMEIPGRLSIPSNLYFTGTVNVDETTHMFSPKVLDRAFAVELTQVDLVGYDSMGAGEHSPLALTNFSGSLVPSQAPSHGDWREFGQWLDGALRQAVIDVHALLTADHRHFGYRVANEMARFVNLAAEQAGTDSEVLWAALDLAILQKVLPKFHGTQQELEHSLRRLFAFAHTGQPQAEPADPLAFEGGWRLEASELRPANPNDPAPRLPRMAGKVFRMLRRLREQGFTSFIE